jgi:hypothetical protein
MLDGELDHEKSRIGWILDDDRMDRYLWFSILFQGWDDRRRWGLAFPMGTVFWRVVENWSMNSDMCGHFESDHWIIGMINSIVG